MKSKLKLWSTVAGICFLVNASAQTSFGVKYNPDEQPGNSMQYFKPSGSNLFVGDCIPFFHNGTYYLYWLLDSAHHSALNGLGGHQWALSTSTDLKTWKHFPVVLGIDEDWEKSICTGSVVYSKNKYYAFYATRLVAEEGKINEKLSYAVSNDGVHFVKQKPNPFYSFAPGYSKRDFRDPKAIVDESGMFHLFVSSALDSSLIDTKGALVHLVSKDLKNWTVLKPLLINQKDVPECPDYFKWNGWYYLIYGRAGNTFYLKSRNPYGPWEYPSSQALNEDWTNVAKTAEFKNGRRIEAAWIPNKRDSKDNGGEIFGGNAVFREVIQDASGVLQTKFPEELIPQTGAPVALSVTRDSLTSLLGKNSFEVRSLYGTGAAQFTNVPSDCRITLEIEPGKNIEEYGLFLRAASGTNSGYKLSFSPVNNEVSLHNTKIQAVDFLNKRIKVDIVMKGDIIDVCIDKKRCIVNRLYERKGSTLWIFSKQGEARFYSITISPLADGSKM